MHIEIRRKNCSLKFICIICFNLFRIRPSTQWCEKFSKMELRIMLFRNNIFVDITKHITRRELKKNPRKSSMKYEFDWKCENYTTTKCTTYRLFFWENSINCTVPNQIFIISIFWGTVCLIHFLNLFFLKADKIWFGS